MKRLHHVLLAMTVFALGFASSAQAQTSGKEHEVIKLEREIASGFRNGDSSAFERYVSNDYSSTNASGQIVTKQQSLQSLKNPNLADRELAEWASQMRLIVAKVNGEVVNFDLTDFQMPEDKAAKVPDPRPAQLNSKN
jgi:hypothetical protein